MKHVPGLLLAMVLLLAAPLRAADDYAPGPDSLKQEGVPQGEVTKSTFAHSKIFPGTTRDYWVYVPKQYDPARPACVLVCQDGVQYGAPQVFNNLIQRKEIPVLIGVFVAPGMVKAASTNALPRYNRSYEYDGLGDEYARFLLEELLPEVAAKYNLSTNGNDRAIAGASSGAIAAFTAAWERPEAFSRVFSSIGTYVGLRGGNVYPILIRKTEPKPIRVFLQDGSHDQNIYGGNWFLANEEMLSALEFAGYEVNHAWGDGGHTGKHAQSIFPEAMRWLWKDYPAPVTAGKGSPQPLMDVLIPGEGWQLASGDALASGALAANASGEVFFTDAKRGIQRIGLDGRVSPFAGRSSGAKSLRFGPDGKLYACLAGRKKLAAYDTDGRERTAVSGVNCDDLAVTHAGEIYFTDTANRRIWLANTKGERRMVDEGIAEPGAVCLTPDQSLLLVADRSGQFVYSFQIETNGSLAFRQRYFHLHLTDGSAGSGAGGMTVDTRGWLYVTTEAGLQVCDQAGRVNFIINQPGPARLSKVVFGGPNFDELYVTCGERVFKRKTKARGVLSAQAPVKPPGPRL